MGAKDPLSQEEIDKRLQALPNWKKDDKAIIRVQTFPKYLDALEYVNRVGKTAEKENHHPDIFMNYKRVTVRYWTHTARGVTEMDFKLAHKVEALVEEIYMKRERG